MTALALREGRIEGARRLVRDPFFIAFVLGAVVLTVLPFVQRLTLRAPAPLAALGAWQLDGVGSAELDGKVWMASFVPSPCDQECTDALSSFGRAAPHVSDLGERVRLVSFVRASSLEGASRVRESAPSAQWVLASGGDERLSPVWDRFGLAWDTQLRAMSGRSIQFMARPTIAVVDQNGAIRGFWPADDEGRGHAINAARMFVRHGATP